MKRLEISVFLSVVFYMFIGIFALNTQCDGIRDSVLRMHVLANSDSSADQELKLKVRDRLLEISSDIYSDASSKEEAIMKTKKNLDLIRDEAKAVIESNGYTYPVSVSLEETYFTTRTYDDFTLPAGNYQALRVVIGDGKGHNWWCVMFPPLCISAASENEAQLSDILNSEQLELVEGNDYEIKFKCVEIYEELKKYLSENHQ